MPSADRRFGEQTVLFRDLAVMGSTRGVQVVVLTPGFYAHRLGYLWRTNRFVRESVRLPDVVLRRTGTFQAKHLRVAEIDLQYFRRTNRLHTLPRECGNKWIVLSLFRQLKALRSHIPETVTAVSATEVLRCLERLGDVYVKPLAGAQGISIYQLVSEPGTGIRVRYDRRDVSRTTERLTRRFEPSTTLVEQHLSTRAAFVDFWRTARLPRCIVQETVRLPRMPDGRLFDFRWLVQYVADQPRIVARVARVGRPHAVTTNIHTGGVAMAAHAALQAAGRRNADGLINGLDAVAMEAAECLRRRYGPYAEVGVDLALRPDGSVVIFEVNPTPGRRMLRSLGEEYRQLSLEYLLEYAIRANR